jgi:CBS domain containing-hemolysin-like protein
LVKDLNESLDLLLPSEEVDTVAGLVLSQRGQVPTVGDEVVIENTPFRVEAMDGRSITLVSVELTPEQLQLFNRLRG